MFGRHVLPDSPHPTPRWIKDLVDAYLPGSTIAWWPVVRAKRYGCIRLSRRPFHLDLHCTEEQTEVSLHLVLHEIAHGLTPFKGPNPYRAGKPTYHHVKFWEVAARLYAHWGVYDYAMNGGEGYAGGRRFLKENVSRFNLIRAGSIAGEIAAERSI